MWIFEIYIMIWWLPLWQILWILVKDSTVKEGINLLLCLVSSTYISWTYSILLSFQIAICRMPFIGGLHHPLKYPQLSLVCIYSRKSSRRRRIWIHPVFVILNFYSSNYIEHIILTWFVRAAVVPQTAGEHHFITQPTANLIVNFFSVACLQSIIHIILWIICDFFAIYFSKCLRIRVSL